MKIGTIDIGTNSMRLLIAEYRYGKLVNRKKYVNTTRIGQGVDKQGYITDDAIERNIKALVEFSNICKEESCEKVYCMGTSALRDSKNKDVFVKLAKDKAGIDVDIISGEKESNLGFMGVLEGIENAEDILVIDIGGGSTEFIIGDKEGIKFSKSENVFESMSNFIYEEVKNTLEYIKNNKVKKLVGIGGTITSLSAMNQELEVYSMEKIHNSKINLSEIELILQNLKRMTLNDKKSLKGLQPKRADIITAGVEILHTIMKNLEIKEITVSEYDNLEGLMCQNIKNMS